jgi:N utilization substance protein B
MGRRLALAAIFEAEFGLRTPDAVLDRHLADSEVDDETATFARALVASVMEQRVTLDATIERFAPQYPVVTLARMDRALLRAGISEVLHSGTPARVAIAEWVELARTYSGEPMRRLVNGVLGRIAAGSGGPSPSAAPPESSEEGVSGHNIRTPEEDRRRAARRR